MRVIRRHTAVAAIDSAAWTPARIETLIAWAPFHVSIKEGGQSILDGQVEAPAAWSQNAVNILAHKYLRKAGVPSATVPTAQAQIEALDSASIPTPTDTNAQTLPRWLLPKLPALGATIGCETSAKQAFRRLAGHWTYAAYIGGYFDDVTQERKELNAEAFYDEIFYMLATQMAAPNSPQWFNTGLWWAYGLTGKTSYAAYRSDGIGKPAQPTLDLYQSPQTSACFILGLEDRLHGDDSIFETLSREARIFKYGSGSGINYSRLRGKNAPLSNGGTSSGLMSFLKLFDAGAGTVKSGGTTRRAARMAIVDADHPEALAFASWKAREEAKVAALNSGASRARPRTDIEKKAMDDVASTHFEGEAFTTVSGQNANNSIRVTDEFMRLIEETVKPGATAAPGSILSTSLGTEHHKRAERLWRTAVSASWSCGDPGFQFHDTINAWHTIPKHSPQRATNPCSEYSFIDNSSCNLASINLAQFWEPSTLVMETNQHPSHSKFDVEGYQHAVRLWTIVLDVSVGMSSFPDQKIAENSVDYRAIGLGYANLGGLLLLAGVPYDSEEGRTYAGIVTAIMHGTAWHTSQEIASALGPFRDYADHAVDVARVLEMHRDAARELVRGSGAQLVRLDGHPFSEALKAVEMIWGTSAGFLCTLGAPIRNAQLTLLAPTGTTGLVMDVATTGVEPSFSLVTYKKLAGGGSLTLTNPLIQDSLRGLGYSDTQIREIAEYIQHHGTVGLATPHLQKQHLQIFACANDIGVEGHLGMMAAVQPFLSGAISKTVNLPNSATEADISSAYFRAWQLGLKAIALYRDGCKLSQPMVAAGSAVATNQLSGAPDVSPSAPAALPQALPIALTSIATLTGTLPPRGQMSTRYKLPSRRNGVTQKVKIGGQTLYLRTGEYPDGQIGELFLSIGKDGSTMRHLLDALAIAISLGLQHGVPLTEYTDAYIDTRSDPCGLVQGSENVRMCSSIMDYLAKELSAMYASKPHTAPAHVEGASPPSAFQIQSGPPTPTAPVELKVVQSEPLSVGLRTLAAPRYSGQSCPSCRAFTLRRAGTCHVCDTCGSTTGCS